MRAIIWLDLGFSFFVLIHSFSFSPAYEIDICLVTVIFKFLGVNVEHRKKLALS